VVPGIGAQAFDPSIPAHWKLRQEDLEFKPSLGYTVRPCLKNKEDRMKERLLIIHNV
jgi:hypothetical protein